MIPDSLVNWCQTVKCMCSDLTLNTRFVLNLMSADLKLFKTSRSLWVILVPQISEMVNHGSVFFCTNTDVLIHVSVIFKCVFN